MRLVIPGGGSISFTIHGWICRWSKSGGLGTGLRGAFAGIGGHIHLGGGHQSAMGAVICNSWVVVAVGGGGIVSHLDATTLLLR